MSLLPPALQHIQAFVFDLGGTLYEDDQALPDALETVRALRDAGYPVRFATNTTSQSRPALVQKLRGLRFSAQVEEVYSPPAAASAFLRERDASAHLLVLDAAQEDFADVRRAGGTSEAAPEEVPDFVVVGDLGGSWTFDRLNDAFRMIESGGAGLIGLGRTRYWQRGGALQLDAGPFIAALEYATGREALVLGKPALAFFESACSGLDVPAEAVAFVGDDIETDVRAAMRAGLTGVLVRTGKYRDGDEAGNENAQRPPPDLVIDSLSELLA